VGSLRFPQLALIFALGVASSGCSAFSFFGKDDAEPVQTDGKGEAKLDKDGNPVAAAKPTAQDEQELKIAKLWARVDELEEEQYRQKERIRVLEKGMTLGLVPEELKHPPKVQKTPKPEPQPEAKDVPKNEDKKEAKADAAKSDAAPAMSKEETEKYQSMLASAHDQYRSGRYGRAIVEYSDIAKTFGEKIEGGMPQYWIAKSWSNLKEYNTARQNLVEFLKSYPTSAWAPRAKLELARVEWQLGLQETALTRFREVIQEHPYEDAAEMAKMELENLDKKI
jgi:TolA-binding protein